jgi:hypothetical protein
MPLVVPGNMGDRDSINRILGGSEPHPERPKRQRHHPRSASNQSASSSVN